MSYQEPNPGTLSEEKKRCQNLIHLANLLLDRAIQSISSAKASKEAERVETRLIDRLSAEEIDTLLSQILLEEDK